MSRSHRLSNLVLVAALAWISACGGGGGGGGSGTSTTPPPPAATCSDGVKNGAETGVDCGGGTCPPCAATKGCLVATDCQSAVCTAGVCQAPTCTDGVKNGAETGVDCGGGTCAACASGKGCLAAADCQSGVCTGNVCQAPTCADGVKNGAETDVDCGGGTCAACAAGKSCLAATDCAGGAACTAGICGLPPSIGISSAPYGSLHARLHFGPDQFAPASFTVRRSTSPGDPAATAVATPVGSARDYLDAGLSVGTTYYYTVSATGPQGAVTSTEVQVVTAPPPTFTAPPTGLVATWVPPVSIMDLGHVHLEWDPYPGANAYEVYRTPVAELVGNQQFANLLGVTSGATAIDDGAVIRGVRYHYFVIAHDTLATPQRVSDPATVSAAAPGTPVGCDAPVVDTVSSAPDLAAAQFFFWGGANARENHVFAGLDPAAVTPLNGGTSAPLDGPPNNLPIVQVRPGYYRMDVPWSVLQGLFGAGATVHVAAESWGLTAAYRSASLQHASFLVPASGSASITDLAAARLNPRAVQLTWSPMAFLIDGYDVYRLAAQTDTPSATNQLAALWGTNSYLDTTASPSTTYFYRVIARKTRSSFPSNAAQVKTFSDWPPVVLPPVGLPFTGSAELGWSSFNDGTTFKVYGGTSFNPLDLPGFSTALLPVTVTTYSNFGMTLGGAALSCTTAQRDATRTSLFLLKVWGRWWVSEVYPDGTESAKSASLPMLLW